VRHLLSRLRGYFIFNPLIWIYTVVLGTVSLITSLWDRDGHQQHRIARFWSWLILKTIHSPLTISGLDKIDKTKPHLYAVNHLSAMDIPALYVALPFQFHILAKKSLFHYPFLGWHLRRSGQIPVDAESALASMRSLNRAAESLKGGMPLVIFPEGGRCRDGHLQPFMPGGFYVAIKSGADIVPMALVGTFELLPMNTFHIQPRPLYLLVGEPISSKGYTSRQVDQLSAVVHKAIADLYYSKAEVGPRSAAPTQAQPAG
jgi:1-acyl-sn-glycerol-3-phosphate acyltransferase